MNIKLTIWGAFGYVYEYRKPFSKALFIPILIIVGLDVLLLRDFSWPSVILHTFLSITVYSIVAITTHRIILLGPGSIYEWGIYMPTKREFYFILYSIGMCLFFIPCGLLALIPEIGWILGVIATIYILARLSLVFPAIATDQNWSFIDSWKATKNHQLLMMTVIAVFPFAVGIPEQLLSNLPYLGLLVNLLSAITMVFVIAALSVAFQLITEGYNGNQQAS